MKYYSLNNPDHQVSFKEAVIAGLAPDKGLYFPCEIPQLERSFFEQIEHLDNKEIAYRVIKSFIGDEIPKDELLAIINETLCFDFPTAKVVDDIYALELYHGPTLAFKDVGARFMSRCLRYFTRDSSEKIKVLVATSGDTGGAVANGFLGVAGVDVIILYPSGKVSSIQEQQLATLGQNIKAIEVNGSFDDCQDMVKQAFLDAELKDQNLTSANSINVARWLPQMFYYFFMYKALKIEAKPITVSVPSGNFGNICAGLMALKMGLPIAHFVASTNVNDTVPRYLDTLEYKPQQTVETLSNAMDVSNPSNFVRILELFDRSGIKLREMLTAYSFSDLDTLAIIDEVNTLHSYLMDPHGAVGFLGLRKYLSEVSDDEIGVFLETAHPIKFPESIENKLGVLIPTPPQVAALSGKDKITSKISTYDELRELLKL